MRGAHPRFDRAEWMFGGLATQAHHLGRVIQASLHRF